VPDFHHYIGVRYSGRRNPGTALREIQVFAAVEDHEPYRESNPGRPSDGRWSRRDLAEWLLGKITGGEPAIVGIDHAFSFPQSYMDRNNLRSWDGFLKDFEGHWPTRELAVRELLPGNPRTGDPDEHRLAGQWTAFPTSVFHFDIQDSLAKATHAGLPWIDYLRRAGDRAHFWPFDGFKVPAGKSVVAEVRPARLRHRYRKEGLSRQEQDAYAVCAWLQERDRLGLLRPYFTPPLSDAEKERARLEGWILGVA
jgi:hypothetical protein